MTLAWDRLQEELERWRDCGRVADLWWRDDDAGPPTLALDRLCQLAQSSAVPLALAVIPQQAHAELVAPGHAGVTIVQHGCDHRDRASEGQKKTEFPASEPVAQALARLDAALLRIQGPHTLPVLVPPWNRIASPALLGQLPAAGYVGLSRFGPRVPAAAPAGLVQVNTHVDIIDWRGGRGFVGDDAALAALVGHLRARREDRVEPDEATGVLSHHAVHDEPCWRFLARLFERTRRAGVVRWRSARELFCAG